MGCFPDGRWAGSVHITACVCVRSLPPPSLPFVAAPGIAHPAKRPKRWCSDKKKSDYLFLTAPPHPRLCCPQVSDPDQANYGQYLKQAEIDELTAPTASDLNAVTGWLTQAGASFTLAGTHVIEVTAPVAVAEAMLSTTWHTLVNGKTGQSVDRAAGYTVPAEVAGSIAALHSV